ncbi:MAG: adenine deaminase, partial [Halobacteriales archaeon]
MNDSRLGDIAVGNGTADLVVRGGTVFSPEIRELLDRDVAVADGRVAALPEDADGVVGPDTTV